MVDWQLRDEKTLDEAASEGEVISVLKTKFTDVEEKSSYLKSLIFDVLVSVFSLMS